MESLEREVRSLETLTKDLQRMEMQIEQLISIVANQNKRLNRIEDGDRKNRLVTIRKIPYADASDGIYVKN